MITHHKMRAGAALIAALLAITAGAAMADGRIADPWKACAEAGALIGARIEDDLVAYLVAATREKLTPDAVRNVVAPLKDVTGDAGTLQWISELATREYGERIRRYWFLVLFQDGTTIYIHCRMMKPDDGWQLVDFDFNSDYDEIGLPN